MVDAGQRQSVWLRPPFPSQRARLLAFGIPFVCSEGLPSRSVLPFWRLCVCASFPLGWAVRSFVFRSSGFISSHLVRVFLASHLPTREASHGDDHVARVRLGGPAPPPPSTSVPPRLSLFRSVGPHPTPLGSIGIHHQGPMGSIPFPHRPSAPPIPSTGTQGQVRTHTHREGDQEEAQRWRTSFIPRHGRNGREGGTKHGLTKGGENNRVRGWTRSRCRERISRESRETTNTARRWEPDPYHRTESTFPCLRQAWIGSTPSQSTPNASNLSYRSMGSIPVRLETLCTLNQWRKVESSLLP